MLAVVLAQNFNLAPEVIVGALDKLVLTHVLVLLNVLSEHLGAAFVIALDHFEEAALIMRLQILEHYHRRALVVGAHNPAEDAILKVLVKLTAPQLHLAAVLKEAFAFVWAVDHLLGALLL